MLKQVVVDRQTARFDAGLLHAGQRLTMSYKPRGADRETYAAEISNDGDMIVDGSHADVHLE